MACFCERWAQKWAQLCDCENRRHTTNVRYGEAARHAWNSSLFTRQRRPVENNRNPSGFRFIGNNIQEKAVSVAERRICGTDSDEAPKSGVSKRSSGSEAMNLDEEGCAWTAINCRRCPDAGAR